MEGGVFKPGDEVVALPSGFRTTIRAIQVFDEEQQEAFAPMSVTMLLEDDIDISRGDMLVKPNNQPETGQDLEVMICWLNPAPLREGGKYAVKHTTRDMRCIIKEVKYKLDINTLHRVPNDQSAGLNDIARVQLRVTQPLFFDSYKKNRGTGSLILIDEHTNDTVAAGMIL